jgi:hypothetical protein
MRKSPQREGGWIAPASLACSFHFPDSVQSLTQKSSHMVAILAACQKQRLRGGSSPALPITRASS